MLVAILGGIIQFGLIFWAQNTLTQVVRDTGRWAVTQTTDCTSSATWTTAQNNVVTEAKSIASSSSLLGYPPTPGWQLIPSGSTAEGVAVQWAESPANAGDTCPASSNAQVWFVTITINHSVPTFFPGMQYLPGLGSNGQLMLSSTATFRMEPEPAP